MRFVEFIGQPAQPMGTPVSNTAQQPQQQAGGMAPAVQPNPIEKQKQRTQIQDQIRQLEKQLADLRKQLTSTV